MTNIVKELCLLSDFHANEMLIGILAVTGGQIYLVVKVFSGPSKQKPLIL